MADSATDTWPEPVYFPQKTDGTPLLQPKTMPVKPDPSKSNPIKSNKEKKGIWPFNRKKEAVQPALSEEQIVKVGPKEPPASPYPLLRIPMPIQTESGLIQPGIYLIKPLTGASPDGSGKTFLLTQRDRVVLQFQVQTTTLPDANIEKEGTPSPLSKTDPKLPTPMKVETKVSDDRKTLTIQVTQDNQTYESPSFPTATDRRPVLRY